MAADPGAYGTRLLSPDTWDDFARSSRPTTASGVGAGAWASTAKDWAGTAPQLTTGRPSKRTCAPGRCTRCWSTPATSASVGASSARLPSCPPSRTAARTPRSSWTLPDWRIGCIFTGKGHRGTGCGPGRGLSRAGRHPRRRRWRGRGLPRAGRRSPSAAWCVLPHRAGDTVRGVRLHPRPSDRQVALGHAPEDGRLSTRAPRTSCTTTAIGPTRPVA